MECRQCVPSQPFVVLTVAQFVGPGGAPLERQKQNSHVYRKTDTLPLFFQKNQSRYINDEVWEIVVKVWSSWRVMDVVLTKKSTFDKTYEKIGVAGSHLSTHDHAISLFVVVATEWKAIKCEY